MKGSVVVKRTHLLNMILDNRSIFLSKVNRESKRFAWGRQTAFEDVLEGKIGDTTDWDQFMQGLHLIFPRYFIADGLDFILGVEEN